jgi:cellulose synthase/poly-beta-1,6-N-acetylglucosamine synthase-like glycosyltransferase
MPSLELTLFVTVVTSLGLVAYAYSGYPALIWLMSRLFGRERQHMRQAESQLPSVTLLIAAHNEEAEIAARIRNALAIRYPADRFEIVIASDGSTDRTVAIARQFNDPRLRVLDFRMRRGKTAVLNDVLTNQVDSEIVILSDANTVNCEHSVRRLAEWFTDSSIGVVCGKLILTDPAGGRNADGLYWKYETFLKLCESRLGALLGSNGGIYAIRRSAFTPLPDNTLVDDFVLPLLARQRTGCQIVYDRDAVATEETPATMACEYHRRARIGAGGFQSIGILKGLLHPRHGWVMFTFLSHKVLRWLCPFFLILALFGAAALTVLNPDHIGLLAVQLAFYMLAVAAGSLPTRPKFLKVLRLPALFTMMNAALFVGFLRWLRGPGNGTWRRTERTQPAMSQTRPVGSAAETEFAMSALIADETRLHRPLDVPAATPIG